MHGLIQEKFADERFSEGHVKEIKRQLKDNLNDGKITQEQYDKLVRKAEEKQKDYESRVEADKQAEKPKRLNKIFYDPNKPDDVLTSPSDIIQNRKMEKSRDAKIAQSEDKVKSGDMSKDKARKVENNANAEYDQKRFNSYFDAKKRNDAYRVQAKMTAPNKKPVPVKHAAEPAPVVKYQKPVQKPESEPIVKPVPEKKPETVKKPVPVYSRLVTESISIRRSEKTRDVCHKFKLFTEKYDTSTN